MCTGRGDGDATISVHYRKNFDSMPLFGFEFIKGLSFKVLYGFWKFNASVLVARILFYCFLFKNSILMLLSPSKLLYN